MAFVLKIRVAFADNCKSIIVYDNTGVYGVDGNTTGWGNPNPDIALVDTVTNPPAIDITLPDGTVVPTITVYPPLPNINNSGKVITNVDLGLAATDMIPSGAWYFVYTINGVNQSAQDYTATFEGFKWIACQEKCCVNSAAAVPLDCDCKKDKKKIDAFSEIWDEHESMIASAQCGKINEADEKLIRVQALCAESGCNCG